jgi:hypothetical protein
MRLLRRSKPDHEVFSHPSNLVLKLVVLKVGSCSACSVPPVLTVSGRKLGIHEKNVQSSKSPLPQESDSIKAARHFNSSIGRYLTDLLQYVVVHANKYRYSTPAVAKSVAPEWNDEFQIPLNGWSSVPKLGIVLWSKERFRKVSTDDFTTLSLKRRQGANFGI